MSFPGILWIVFAVSLIAFGSVSGILLYHWRRFGMNHRGIVLAEVTYLTVSAVFIIGCFVSLIFI